MKFYNSYDEFVLLVYGGHRHLCHLSRFFESLASVPKGTNVYVTMFDEDGKAISPNPIRLGVYNDLDNLTVDDDEGDSEECDS